MKRIALTILVFLLVIFLGWYAGEDFMIRNQDHAGLLIIAIGCALVFYFLPIHNQPNDRQNHGDTNEK